MHCCSLCHLAGPPCLVCAVPQASLIAEEILRNRSDAVRILYNKFHSAISFKPTMATVLSAEVGLQGQYNGST